MLGAMAYRLTTTSLLPLALEAALLASSPALGGGPDFNGDGYADLAVGIPGDTIAQKTRAGSAAVAYGSADGPGADFSQLWTQNSPGVGEAVNRNDRFGRAVASGDFNGDGFDDLAVGAPEENRSDTIINSGCVNVIYGGAAGLAGEHSQLLYQGKGKGEIPEQTERNDWFGYALAAGDFNGDGYDDLAIGAPWEKLTNSKPDGVVHVLFGSDLGLRAQGSDLYSRASLVGANQLWAQFGFALCAADFDGDGFDDLAIGVPGLSFTSGEILVLVGGVGGFDEEHAQVWTQNSAGVGGQAITHEQFGFALAAGDLNDDGFDDLAVGAPFDDSSSGGVNLLYGSASGLTGVGSDYLTAAILAPSGGADVEPAYVGGALAIGDVDGDGFDDLIIAAPGARVFDIVSGAAYVLFGSNSGLSMTGIRAFSAENLASISLAVDPSLGATSLYCGDYNGDGRDDLIIGAPGQNGGAPGSGVLVLLPGSDSGPDIGSEQTLTQEEIGDGDVSRKNEGLGWGFPL